MANPAFLNPAIWGPTVLLRQESLHIPMNKRDLEFLRNFPNFNEAGEYIGNQGWNRMVAYKNAECREQQAQYELHLGIFNSYVNREINDHQFLGLLRR